MKPQNNPAVERFLIKLDWALNVGDLKDLDTFQIDVYKFKFPNGLGRETAGEFAHYLKRLNLTEIRSVMKMFVWLYQRNVKFSLTFAWNRRLPVRYNLKSLGQPRNITKQLLACGHEDLMSCPVELMDEGD